MSFRYRLALDAGSSSLGWAVFKLDDAGAPKAIVVAGVRIFPDGRNPKDGSSLAVTRREARAMRRRRDRLLRRKNRLLDALVHYGFFPVSASERKALERLDPYMLRAKGVRDALTPVEFGRALFHLNQRRGFKSNRKTDKRQDDSSVMKGAISNVRQALSDGGFLSVGDWLWHRKQNGESVRARFRQVREATSEGKNRIKKSYDLYIDRDMVEQEFDALWNKQAEFNPSVFHEDARSKLKDILLFQRKLRPVDPGRCTFFPEEKRAALALPSVQRFRIYQEVNNLRWLDEHLQEQDLTLDQRDLVVHELERSAKRTFTQVRALLNLDSGVSFNIEDAKRQELKGNTTSSVLARKSYFGTRWHSFSAGLQDEIVTQLLTQEVQSSLVEWLKEKTGASEEQAVAISDVDLVSGYGSLSSKAVQKILPQLQREVCTYDVAVRAAGFEHHSYFGARAAEAALSELPYYGLALQRSVGFGTGVETDSEEKRYGRIANPTVHIALNQIRKVVNEIIRRYGNPSQVVIELARELKQSWEQRKKIEEQQVLNQRRNERYRRDISELLGISEDRVKRDQIQRMILWNELSFNPAERRCPYSGVQISLSMLMSDEVEIEHILPFSRTLDDSLNNKTVSLRSANRLKSNLTPWEAFGKKQVAGFDYEAILARAKAMPLKKRYRFAADGYERWCRDDKDFLARALNDTRYLSRVAMEYLTLVCPKDTWAITGQLTSMLRGRFGLNNADIIGWDGKKNRDDHRHHAIDACVIGITDRSMLQRIASANASARESMLGRLLDEMPKPWPTYREHVKRAVSSIWVSHKPDHGYQRAMHDDTAYSLLDDGRVAVHKEVDGVRQRVVENLRVVRLGSRNAGGRHGYLPDGSPKPYKGYKGNSNYCIEIVVDEESGRWLSDVISTFQAYHVVRESGYSGGWKRLRHPGKGLSGKPLVMRLMINDMVRLEDKGRVRTMRVATISRNGQMFFSDIQEANVDARNRDKENPFAYISKTATSLQQSHGRRVTISPAGRLCDPGYI